MTSYLPPLKFDSSIFNVDDYNYQDSYISYYVGDLRYGRLNRMNTFTQLCYFNGGIYATSIYENGIDISLKYAPINNANLTGVPICPTAPNGTITNQIANTTYVNNSIANIAFPIPDLSNYMDLTSSQTCSGSKVFSTQVTTPVLILNGTNLATTISGINSSIALKANIASPVFTTQITTPVLILNGTNIITTIGLKANIASPVFTTQITTPKVILGSSDLQGLLDLKSPINSPTFTTQITTPKIILGSTDLQELLDLKSPINSPTFTTQITTPKIILGSTDLQTTLNTKISNLDIGTVSSLPYGSVPSVIIDNTNPLIPKLNFGIITGQKGDQGDKGNDGDSTAATAAAVASAAAATAAVASAATAASAATGSAASAATAAASATAAEESATLATLKVRHFTASDLPNREILNGQLNVKDTTGISTVISLSQSGDISTSNSISVNPSGSSNVFTATSDGNLTTTGRISLDNGRIITGKNVLNLNTINIGTNLVDGANIITIGNGLSQVIIQGTLIYASGNNFFNVSQFINQFS